MRLKLTYYCILFIAQLGQANPAHWQGGSNGDWNVASNWSCNCVPVDTTLVYIPDSSGTVVIPAGYAATAHTIAINTGSGLVSEINSAFYVKKISSFGYIINNGSIHISNPTGNDIGHGLQNWVDGTVTNNGLISIDNVQGPAIENLGDFVNLSDAVIQINNVFGSLGIENRFDANFENKINGNINIQNTETHGLYSESSSTKFINKGNISISKGIGGTGLTVVSGEFTNESSGNITIDSCGNHGVSLLQGAIFDNDGTVIIQENIIGSAITVSSNGGISQFLNNQFGILKGVGSIIGNITNMGKIEPGLSPGILAFLNPHDLEGDITYEIAGNGSAGAVDGYDRITIVGTGAMIGNVTIELINGFTPQSGDTYSIIHCSGGCMGTFNNIILPDLTAQGLEFKIFYNPNSISVEIQDITVLPVELTSFYGENRGKENQLLWEVNSIHKTSNFIIERSLNGKNWNVAGNIYVTNTNQDSFFWVDKTPSIFTYYRLKTMDFDGTFEVVSDVILLEKKGYSFDFKITPNPFSDYIQFLNFDKNNAIQLIEIYTVNGQKQKQLEFPKESHQINLKELPFGLWFISIHFENGLIQTFKMTKTQ